MTLLQRLFRPAPDPREGLQPLWHGVVVAARDPAWYRDGGVVDSVEGRFDMVTVILAAVLVRLDRSGEAQAAVHLTELFIADMDAQLRQSGVGDLVVGKHVGKLMAALGGRVAALRGALSGKGEPLAQVLERNVTLREGFAADALAAAFSDWHGRLDAIPDARLLTGEVPR